MLLAEIFDYLNYGELSQLGLGNENRTGLSQDNYSALTSHLNLGLTELYKRFPLRKGTINIQRDPTILEYKIAAKYSTVTGIVGASTPILYLIDTLAKPFTNRLVKIERITTDNTEVIGDVPLNDVNEELSIFTPEYNIITVPAITGLTELLTIHYRAAPERINLDGDYDPETLEIPIPESLAEPLLFYMASRAHGSISSIDGNMSEATMYLSKFEASVLKAKEEGVVENTNRTNIKPIVNGWV